MIANGVNRGLDIYNMKESGASYSTIAKKWGISRTRVEQIYKRVKRQHDTEEESMEEYGIKLSDWRTLKFLKEHNISGITSRGEAIETVRKATDNVRWKLNHNIIKDISKLLCVECKWVSYKAEEWSSILGYQNNIHYRLKIKSQTQH